MDPFSQKAFGLLVWRAFLTALVAVLLAIAGRLPLPIAFLAGADVALLFSLGLIAWSQFLTDERVVSTEAWRMLDRGQRPGGIAGRRWACRHLRDEALLFAKAASAVAAALSASAFVFAAE
jgi:hypothetical protein